MLDMQRWCRAEAAFRKAIELEPYEKSYEQLGKVLIMQERPNDALTVYMQSLQLTPDNADILCQIGLLHLRQGNPKFCHRSRIFAMVTCRIAAFSLCSMQGRTAIVFCVPAGDNDAALATLQKANNINPQHAKATLALGSVLQDGLDLDGALLKYRVAATMQPNIPQVCMTTFMTQCKHSTI